MSIKNNLENIRKEIPANVKLIAISKFHPAEKVQEAYDASQRLFGESRMQELDEKQVDLPKDIEWHFIGHLQRNKVKTILPYTHTIHSVDSLRLFKEIVKQAENLQIEVSCLIQLHIADEDSKYGFTFDECRAFLSESKWTNNKFAKICGVMGMATLTDDMEQVRGEFRKLKQFFDELKRDYFVDDNTFKEISMGMSGDYRIAIEEGSTMVRIGTAIFGEREN